MDAVAGFLSESPVAFVALGTLFGLCVGSFLNVVIHRLPKVLERQWRAECAELQGLAPPEMPRYNLFFPRSACPKCDHRLSALENIPIVSYALLGAIRSHRVDSPSFDQRTRDRPNACSLCHLEQSELCTKSRTKRRE